MQKGIYKFKVNLDYAKLSGLFIAPKEYIEELVNSKLEVYFGEIAGKHSEISGAIKEKEITLISDKEEDIEFFERLNLETGINLFNCQPLRGDEETVGEEIEKQLKLKINGLFN